MASRISFVLGTVLILICGLLFLQATAEDNNTFIESRRELLPAIQLLNLFKNLKYIFQIFDYYGKVQSATDFANWIISEAEGYVDQQCQNSTTQQNYCCLNDLFLQCEKCCSGLRPNSSSLEFSPAPAPAPAPLP
ncbi:uncharacterized protein LOC112497691 [Citrus sinensis]|uniref:uncharacterized protein LOC112497691 n=1 Tax=Citrus sinensis TaxID=2711 RepID=UPI002277E34D|nr:uncharacterized protein LOC112497691 [Citrus sinensis]